jgi:hypothetical protein
LLEEQQSMTEDQKKLWHNILNFEIDDINSSLTFSDRLARENNWSLEYSLRAILEYKKFIFLITISKTAQTPSDQVDQVWHLHLLYTQSYWIDLCKNTIQKEIHHGPTKGTEQKAHFKDLYLDTLALYKTVFGHSPPDDIWPDAETRFKNIHFTRINRHKFWVFPKLTFKRK